MVPKHSLAIAVVVLLSIVVAGTVVAQSEASIERDAPSSADFNETITVEVTVVGNSLEESFNKDVDPTIVDADGGETTESADELNVSWTESGEYTVTYEVRTGETNGTLTIKGTVSNGSDEATASSTTTISVSAWYDPYHDEDGVVRQEGLNDAINDYLVGRITHTDLNNVIRSYLLEVPLEEVES